MGSRLLAVTWRVSILKRKDIWVFRYILCIYLWYLWFIGNSQYRKEYI